MKLLYIYDPLCGWCYGFGPVMKKVQRNFGNRMKFDVISGGMITGSRVGPLSEVADYIGEACKVVEKTTGVKFGEGFVEGSLKKGDVLFDSYPPSKALTVFKDLKPQKTLAFSKAIQDAIYKEGKDPSDERIYFQLAADLGADQQDFKILWASSDYDVRTREDFVFANRLGVTGFPAVFFENEGKYHVVSRGYTEYGIMEDRLNHLVEAD